MDLLDFLIPAAGTVVSGLLGARGAERAGETAADASQYAADLQFQSAQDLLDFQKNIFGYQTAQDAYNRQQAERALGLNIGAYGDQYGLTQRTFDIMGNQLGYGNALRQNAMGNLQQFTNLGLGSLGGLAAMTGGTGAGITGPSPYNVQAPGPIAPLGPSQVQYTPQDTEALFRSILDNPSFQLPVGEDEEEDTTESDRQLAESLADWYIRTLGGEAGGQSGGPAGRGDGFDTQTDAPGSGWADMTGSAVLSQLLSGVHPVAGLAVSAINNQSFRDFMLDTFGIDLSSLAFNTASNLTDAEFDAITADLGWGDGFGGFGGSGGYGDLGDAAGPLGDHSAGDVGNIA